MALDRDVKMVLWSYKAGPAKALTREHFRQDN